MTMNMSKTLLALGFAGAMAIGTAAPSMAQGVYFEGPGIGVQVGRPYYRHHYYGPYAYERPHYGYWRHRHYRSWDW